MATATLKLTYFKPSGKYYSEGEIEVDSSTDWNTCIELVRFRFEGACLPGLVTGAKNYIVHVNSDNHPSAYPAIITKSLRHCCTLID